MRRRARARARAVLARDVEAFAAAAGYTETGRRGELRATMTRPGRTTLRLELVPTGGRIFGGAYALEISTARPVLPRSEGLGAKGKGVVRMQGIAFKPRKTGAAGATLAARLGDDDRLVEALQRVHFERVRVEPDGRPVIRHMGGSVVWMLFPPMARPIAIGDEQVRATVDALEAFAAAGGAVGER